jgi:hypothetical protein
VTKLYHVTTVVKEYNGHKNVSFKWFFAGMRHSRLPYTELIAGYDPDDEDIHYPEGAVDEMFTEDEANQLKSYLDREHGGSGTTSIKAAEIPIPKNTISAGALPVGGPQDLYQLQNEDRYDLPFEVMGYFDLRQHELIDKSTPGEVHTDPLAWSNNDEF